MYIYIYIHTYTIYKPPENSPSLPEKQNRVSLTKGSCRSDTLHLRGDHNRKARGEAVHFPSPGSELHMCDRVGGGIWGEITPVSGGPVTLFIFGHFIEVEITLEN